VAYDVAEDIKQAYIEVGTSYEVLRKGVQVGSGEYLLYDLNAQVTKPFIREHFLEASLPFDTSGEAGDVLRFHNGDCYLLMNKSPFELENKVLEYSTVLYKANTSGELRRPSGEAWDTQTYHKTPIFGVIETNVYSLLTESLFRYELSEQDFGQLAIAKDELYIPKVYGIRLNDRYEPKSGEYYRVTTIKTRGFPGVDVVGVEEDTR
jgi:hypothetical protein